MSIYGSPPCQIDYKGESFTHDFATNTYSRRPVKVRFPCSTCGSPRPEQWVRGASGGYKLEIGVCCRQQDNKDGTVGSNKGVNK